MTAEEYEDQYRRLSADAEDALYCAELASGTSR